MEELHNYLEIKMDELPSRGKAYSKAAQIRGHFLTIADVKFISLITPENASPIIDSVLRRCFKFKNLPYESLLLCDRQYLIFWLRANSYLTENGYQINIKKCSCCGQGYTGNIGLDDININYLEHGIEPIVLPQSRIHVSLKMPTVKSLKYKDEDKKLEHALRMLDVDTMDARDFIQELSAYVYTYLLDYCSSINVGFDMHFRPVCPHCHTENEVCAEIGEENYFASHDLHDILKMTTYITKNVGVQIPDTMTWPELETLRDVSDEIVKAENEENAKQESKAKAKAASMAAQHHATSFHK